MYTQEITRRHRAAFIIAIDRSGSMQELVHFGKSVLKKSEAVAYTANTLISELIDRCRRTDGMRNYYDIAVLGYCNDTVETLLDPAGFVSIDRLAARTPDTSVICSQHDSDDGKEILITHTIKHWIEAKAEGNTPMYEAMLHVRDLVDAWCADPHNRESFPPVVINITDGEVSDCDDNELLDICSQIRRISTDDGDTLLFNIHISTDSTTPAMIFPSHRELVNAGQYARILAECSSEMPEAFNDAVRRKKGAGAEPPFCGMAYNANIVELLSILNIGSRSITNME